MAHMIGAASQSPTLPVQGDWQPNREVLPPEAPTLGD